MNAYIVQYLGTPTYHLGAEEQEATATDESRTTDRVLVSQA